MGLFSKHRTKETEKPQFDPAREKPVLRCSICNGEQVAGFKDLESGKFREYAFIRSQKELDEFMKMCGVTQIGKEY